jgi:hypothetical protein
MLLEPREEILREAAGPHEHDGFPLAEPFAGEAAVALGAEVREVGAADFFHVFFHGVEEREPGRVPNLRLAEGLELAEDLGLPEEGGVEAGANFHEETVGLGAPIEIPARHGLPVRIARQEKLHLAQTSAPNLGGHGEIHFRISVD